MSVFGLRPHLMDVRTSLDWVAASHSPFLRSKNTECASEPPYCSASVCPIDSYCSISTNAMLLSVRGERDIAFHDTMAHTTV